MGRVAFGVTAVSAELRGLRRGLMAKDAAKAYKGGYLFNGYHLKVWCV